LSSSGKLNNLPGGPYFGIKLFNHLPLKVKELAYDIKQFRAALNAFLHSKSYTLDEYFN
jgi:hypothetical protein